VVALLESLTGAAPSVGFVHGMLTRTAGLLGAVHERIRALITQAHAVSCDETTAQGGAAHAQAG
jgi:transposase